MWIDDSRPIVFDTDGLTAFVGANRLDIIEHMFSGRILVPEQVIAEFKPLTFQGPNRRLIYDTLHAFIAAGKATPVDMAVGSKAAEAYLRLRCECPNGMELGKGECAAMAIALDQNGAVASNNLCDVDPFCSKHGIEVITTEQILVVAHARGKLSDIEAQIVWNIMERRGSYLRHDGFKGAMTRWSTLYQITKGNV